MFCIAITALIISIRKDAFERGKKTGYMSATYDAALIQTQISKQQNEH